MTKSKSFFMLAPVLLACTSVALADQVSLYVSSTLTYSYQGEWVGPVPGAANAGTPIGLWCDDYTHVTYVPQTFNAYVSTIPALEHARWKNLPNAVALYEQAAWLMGQFYAPGFTKNNTSVGDLQFAIWALFNPTAVSNDHKLTAGAQNWITQVQAVSNLSARDYSNVRIFTPASCTAPNCNNQQEFMALYPVPEPATILTLVGGFGIVALVVRRRAA